MDSIINSCPIYISNVMDKSHLVDQKLSYPLNSTTSVKNLYDYIEKNYQIQADNFKLVLDASGKLIDLSEMKNKIMSEIDVSFSENEDNKYRLFVVRPTDTLTMDIFHPRYDIPSVIYTTRPALSERIEQEPLHQESLHHSLVLEEDNNVDFISSIKPETGYVGLVNQAMTCYLNSLLQALYMTPEFRNALYNWEYTGGSEKDETTSIPYQLQKLFLNLQTSSRSAVETTALTKSFGWDSTEAWQQHDIQELCRVMFDALEQKFINTEQADLINRFYEGTMIDYVKCLECGTEKSREDTFLDIPLPVRPFGRNVAYNSVEEALRAFVQHETLEGSNQYHCEKCNKKCDAHKGLKFIKFPYLLTLHLKRFDFDFNTFRRVKLNDKVTFPNILNLNRFISSTTNEESSINEKNTNLVKCDDSSTTDSGTLDDDYTPCENSLSNSSHSKNNDPDDDDEGVDVLSNGPSTSNCIEHNYENDKNRDNNTSEGRYNYELFSIMIHSGSACGGHYYAYIKDFRTQEWLCFNDQSVTQITNDDIQKTYGGGPIQYRSYHTASCSSTNAYMLMYRQIDPARNVLPMQVQDFPCHIQKLLKKMKENEGYDRRERWCLPYDKKDINTMTRRVYREMIETHLKKKLSSEDSQIRTQPNDDVSFLKRRSSIQVLVGCSYPSKMQWFMIDLFRDITWDGATKLCWQMFNLEWKVNLEQCRLVRYDPLKHRVLCRYEGMERRTFESVWRREAYTLLLEIRDENEESSENEQDVITSKVYVLDVAEKKVTEGPLKLRALRSQPIKEYKKMLAILFGMKPSKMAVMLGEPGKQLTLMDDDECSLLSSTSLSDDTDVFVTTMYNDEWMSLIEAATAADIISSYTNHKNILTFRLKLPDPSKSSEINERYWKEWNNSTLGERCKDTEKSSADSPSKGSSSDSNHIGTPKSNEILKIGKSNEDVSVKNASPQLGENEKWNTPEQSNSEDSSLSDSDKTLVGDALEFDDFNDPYMQLKDLIHRPSNTIAETDDKEYYFKTTSYEEDGNQFLKVEVSRMMNYGMLKKKLAPYIGVPIDCFRISYKFEDIEDYAYYKLQENILEYKEDDYFTVKVGRFFDFRIKIYQLHPETDNFFKFLGAWILSRDITVGEAKKAILENIKDAHDIEIPLKRCRLREKHLTRATKVYLDDQKLDDMQLHSKSEFVIQKLPDEDPVTNSNQIIVRVGNVDRLHEVCQEIVMDEKSIAEMRKKLSVVAFIPEEYIEIAKADDEMSLMFIPLDLERKLTWHGQDSDVEFDINNGSLFLYRDSRYKKELSKIKSQFDKEEERSFTRSRRRQERSLKIHLTSTE
ncbi:ubiquitin specific protease 47 [Megalopta genalis]|uniref:ubiquitin specific protease 47 n=1 Tax=Megalopta genalis TaxID=115081 RepID=UPI001443153D|nr:ubiquitin carboxyl-terminal hydrolase 47 [Megalopta genalis]XP_033328484.1 ubiquitin carboxyl-terminal hydrolase 47 [Megalopta genalis]XP_033328485.1 ubiquitin carboxyl-terminal hydrolase 47 [Megalopta genalis]XP_033328486.1 ubiquitin carboxyl-terminal hydrolase 47 [Megalopta genalis]XP_033328487.1 ubiquitin carboxyl-terminal hydrolase 47 [Megalopta genalis]